MRKDNTIFYPHMFLVVLPASRVNPLKATLTGGITKGTKAISLSTLPITIIDSSRLLPLLCSFPCKRKSTRKISFKNIFFFSKNFRKLPQEKLLFSSTFVFISLSKKINKKISFKNIFFFFPRISENSQKGI